MPTPSHYQQNANKNQGSNWIRRTTRERLYSRDNYTCAYCGCKCSTSKLDPISSRATLDHIDGDHSNNAHTNLRTVCFSCNSKKKGKTHEEYVAYLSLREV